MSRRLQFTIPGRLAGANEVTRANRAHWSKGARLRKDDLETCMWAIRVAMGFWDGPWGTPVAVSFIWIEPDGRRDPDNVMSGQKQVLDALVRLGVIPNDTRQWIKSLTHYFPDPDKKDPRVEVTVEEI
jgi:hypothetical protein